MVGKFIIHLQHVVYSSIKFRVASLKSLSGAIGGVILKGVLRAETQEKALIYLMLRGSRYGNAIAEFYGVPTNPIQKQLARMETDGVVVSHLIGKVRNYELNSRYAFIAPLKELLKAAIAVYPESLIGELMIQRTRPRQAGKPITLTGKSRTKKSDT